MSRSQQRRPTPQKGGKRPGAVDIWKVPGTLPQTEPIAVPTEPGALIRSLGEPPMRDANAATDEFVAVVERAAAIAAALALSADLLSED
jgi:hypothetical protein